jgi:hypothetical protein
MKLWVMGRGLIVKLSYLAELLLPFLHPYSPAKWIKWLHFIFDYFYSELNWGMIVMQILAFNSLRNHIPYLKFLQVTGKIVLCDAIGAGFKII